MAGDMLTASAYDPDHSAVLIFTSVLLLLLLPALLSRARRVVRGFVSQRWITFTCVLAFASSLWSQVPITTAHAACWLCLSVSTVFYINSRFSDEQKMQLIMATGIFAAVLSIGVVLLFPAKGLDHLHQDAWQGVFTSKNHMGRMFVFLLTPALHSRARLDFRIFYFSFIALLIGFSQSRSAWIAAILYLLLAGLLRISSRFTSRSLAYTSLILTSVLATAGWILASNIEAILRMFDRDPSLSGRTTIWNILLLSALKHPLVGFGYQAFWAGTASEGMNAFVGVYGAMHFMASYAHSGYLSVLLETGILGLALLAILIIRAILNGGYCLSLGRKPCVNWYLGIVFLTIIYNVDEVTAMLPAYLPWMMFLLAAIALPEEAARIRRQKRYRCV
jgi:O-antigen ligase